MSEGHERGRHCSKWVGFLCCLPCLNEMTETVAFVPPSPPFYDLELLDDASGQCGLLLSPDADATGLRNIVKQRVRKVKTRLGNEIVVLYVSCNSDRRYTLLLSHTNAVDLGGIHKNCVQFSLLYGCDVVSYDYSGYGRSGGRPSEENVYADIKAVWEYTLTFHEPRADRIILLGQSLGTAPTVDLASKVECAGVVLQSPFMSSMRLACPNCWMVSSCADKFKM